MKKFLSLILTAALLLSIAPAGVFNIQVSAASDYFTEGYYTYRITNGNAEIISVDKSISGYVVIPSELGGYPVTSIGLIYTICDVFEDCTKITGVSIPNGVTVIGLGAFSGCSNLANVTIPASVTYIDYRAFEDCPLTDVYISDIAAWVGITFMDSVWEWDNYSPTTLYLNGVPITELHIPDGVTSINNYAFYNCDSLTKVTIPNSVANIGWYAFEKCSNLANVSIGDGVTSISYGAFMSCKALREVTIGKSVTTIGNYAFYECEKLENIELPESVISIGEDAFRDCESLLSINIPKNVTTIGNAAFLWCSSLTSITIPDGVSKIEGYVFADCFALKTITIPASITSIGDDAFYSCRSLKTVFFKGTQEQKETILIGTDNNALNYAQWHYEVENTFFANQECYYCKECNNYYLYDGSYATATVVFKNWDGTELSRKNYRYNDEITVPPTPQKQSDSTFEYTFIGWDKEVVNCAGDAVYTAVYTPQYIDYTVSFKDWDGTIISSETYHYGDKVTAPATPTRKDDNRYTYTFNGWNKKIVDCTGDATYTATYTSNYIDYTVTFKNYDGTVLSTKTYHYGDKITIPSIPTKDSDATYTYTFAGWDKTVVDCAGDATYTAIYASNYIDYTVVFKNWDGTVLSSKTYHYGDKVTAPSNPVKTADKTYTYTFKGWDKTVVDCVGDATYTAAYTSNYIDYTVVFKNWNGDVLSTKTYHYGDKVTVPSNPTKAADKTYTYTFAGWDSAVVNCAGDATYTATYASNYIDYTVEFKNWNGAVLSTKTYHYGDKVTAPANPTKAADKTYTYTFAGWDNAVVSCAGDATYTAVYTQSYINYTVVFNNYDGVMISTNSYHYGDVVQEPNVPTKDSDQYGTYIFTGWDKPVTNCTNDVVYTATYKTEYTEYVIKFQNWDGSVLSQKYYHYGDQVELPKNPAREANSVYSYNFAGWDKEVSYCAGNTTYTATYTPVYIDYTVVFKDWDGSVISTKTYHYGDKVTAPENPIKDSDGTNIYIFAGWDKTVIDCVSDATYTATYTIHADHIYDNACDAECNICGDTRTITHDYEWIIDRTNNCGVEGVKHEECTICHVKRNENTAIPASGAHSFDNASDDTCNGCSWVRILSSTFTDVPASAWYASAVNYVTSNNLMVGTTTSQFSPSMTMDRRMVVTVLYRMAGSPAHSGYNPFTDLEPGQKWYHDAVIWAAEKGIVAGKGEGIFDPTAPVTREQLAMFLYNYAVFREYDVSKADDLAKFPDKADTSSWAAHAVKWAVAEGLISGKAVGNEVYLSPKGQASRAEVASILMRFHQSH